MLNALFLKSCTHSSREESDAPCIQVLCKLQVAGELLGEIQGCLGKTLPSKGCRVRGRCVKTASVVRNGQFVLSHGKRLLVTNITAKSRSRLCCFATNMLQKSDPELRLSRAELQPYRALTAALEAKKQPKNQIDQSVKQHRNTA